MNSLKKGEGVPLLNFVGGLGVPLLNFEGGPGVPLLNFEGGSGSQVLEPQDPGTWNPGPTFTPCRYSMQNSLVTRCRSWSLEKISRYLLQKLLVVTYCIKSLSRAIFSYM